MKECLNEPHGVIPVLVTGIYSAEFSSAFFAARRRGMDPQHKAEGDACLRGARVGETLQ